MRYLLIGTVLLALAGCDGAGQPQSNEAAAEAEAGSVKGVDRSHKGKPAPDVVFNNPDGGEIRMSAFKGIPTLFNLWASWCAPCVKELPTLDRLAQSHAVEGQLGVVAISQDSGPQPSVKAFLKKHQIRNLGAFHDPKMALSGALAAEVLPTTILYDAAGKEVWRYVGDLDWTSAEAARLLAEAGAPAGER